MEIIVKDLVWCTNSDYKYDYIEYKIVGFTSEDKLLLLKLDGTVVESWLPRSETLAWIIRNNWLIKSHPAIPLGSPLLEMLNSPDEEARLLAIGIIENYKEDERRI